MCYAGYHYDLNFLTIHGKSRFPGLFVWLRNGKRVAVKIPSGCLFIQAGKQLEWLTGGYVKAGMHEVGHNAVMSQLTVLVGLVCTDVLTCLKSVVGKQHLLVGSGSTGQQDCLYLLVRLCSAFCSHRVHCGKCVVYSGIFCHDARLSLCLCLELFLEWFQVFLLQMT